MVPLDEGLIGEQDDSSGSDSGSDDENNHTEAQVGTSGNASLEKRQATEYLISPAKRLAIAPASPDIVKV